MSDEYKEFHTVVCVWDELNGTLLCENHRQAITRLTNDRLHRSRVVFFASVIDIITENVILVVFLKVFR